MCQKSDHKPEKTSSLENHQGVVLFGFFVVVFVVLAWFGVMSWWWLLLPPGIALALYLSAGLLFIGLFKRLN